MDQLRPGAVLGDRYRLVEPIRVHSPGTVWRAVDQLAEREVAVKALGAYLSDDQSSWARARLALQLIAQLQGPGLAAVRDYGRVAGSAGFGVPYLVRDLIGGQTLEERLRQGPLSVSEALTIVACVADALAAVHKAGLVHGNLVPANVVLAAVGPRVTDAGLWVLRDHPAEQLFRSAISYAAPERVAGEPATPATDMYSLGVVFVACLTGISAGGSAGAPLLPDLPGDSAAAGLASLWAACLGASPRDRPSAAHAAVMSRQLISGGTMVHGGAPEPLPAAAREPGVAARELAAAPEPAAAREPVAAGPASPAPGPRPARWERRRLPWRRRGGLLALGGAATGVTVAVMVVLAQFLASPPAPASSPAAAPSVRTHAAAAPGGSPATRPGASAEATASVPAVRPAPVSALAAVDELWRAVHRGAADGQIRPDVAVDFENIIRPARARLTAGQAAGVAALVATLRGKLAARISEGAVGATAARQLGDELTRLAASARP